MSVRELFLEKTEIADGMRIDRNVTIPTDDGIALRADIFRPVTPGRFPVVLSYGPYCKDIPFQKPPFAERWQTLARENPEVLEGSSNKHQAWETVDPEKWVSDGYVVIRVDSRGAGCSPGDMDLLSPRETRDLYECIEWAGVQSWSNGKVGLLGISYYAMNQWLVAALKPSHLSAIIPWEGSGDTYREFFHHGGIPCDFGSTWFRRQVLPVKHAYWKERRGVFVPTPPGDLPPEDQELIERNLGVEHKLDDEWHRARSADWSKITVPFLSSGNWGGQGMHLRSNLLGFMRAASEQKWLEMHPLRHWTHFYTSYGVALQKRFFDHFLKGEKNGWEKQPRLLLQIRHPGNRFIERCENEWPLARTRWTKYYLDSRRMELSPDTPATESAIQYEALGNGLDFSTAPQHSETEITGPIGAKLFISSSTSDADLFVVLRVLDPQGGEVTFVGSDCSNAPIAQGWLRASHRRLDPARTLPYLPWHTHDQIEPLTPNEVYELDIEVWPTCIVIPPGYRIVFTIRGKDHEYEGDASKACGIRTHRNNPSDRPVNLFAGTVTVRTGGRYDSHVLLPIIPSR